MEKMLIIGHNIKALRTAKGMTQATLARLVGVSQAHMSNVEAGERKASVSVLLKIMEVLKCSFADIVEERQETKCG